MDTSSVPTAKCKHPYHEQRPLKEGYVCMLKHDQKMSSWPWVQDAWNNEKGRWEPLCPRTWAGGVVCSKCGYRVKKGHNDGRLERHMRERCNERLVRCEVCKNTVPLSIHKQIHGDNCGGAEMTCRFCDVKMSRDELCKHLGECEKLSVLLMEKYGADCSRLDKELFHKGVVLMRNAGYKRKGHDICVVSTRGFELVRVLEQSETDDCGGTIFRRHWRHEYKSKKWVSPFTRRLFYCASMFGYDILDSLRWDYAGKHNISQRHDGRYYQYTYDMFGLDMLDDLPFILGSDLTKTVLERLCHAHGLVYAHSNVDGPKAGDTTVELVRVNDVVFEFVGGVAQPLVLSPRFINGLIGSLMNDTWLSMNVIGVVGGYVHEVIHKRIVSNS